jgi:predicted DNA-binding antitoxin AbrB/MazE fold protein
MKETLEAIYENGVLRLSKRLALPEGKRIIVTLETTPDGPRDQSENEEYDFSGLAGSLKKSPRFGGNPVEIQKKLRNEWS